MPTTPRTSLDKFSDALTQSEKRVVGVLVLLLAANIIVRIFSGSASIAPSSFRHSLRDAEKKESILPQVQNDQRATSPDQHPRKIFPAERSIDINSAPREELMRLPGVGAAMAERIIAMRRERQFTRRTDLRRVRGIGAKRLAQIAPYLTLAR